MNKFKDVDSYIAHAAKEAQPTLKQLRRIIQKAAPKAQERISYSMPFYEYGGTGYKGRFIYFAAFKKHISLFIMPWHADTLPPDMKKYHISKATYKFPYTEPFPFTLVKKSLKKMRVERDAIAKKTVGKLTTCSRGHTFYKSSVVPTCPTCWPGRYKK